MGSPAGGQEGHRTPERPHRPGAAHRGKVHHVYSPFTEFVNSELPPLNDKDNSDQYSSYNGPDMSSPHPLQMSPLSIRADRDGDANAGPSGSNLTDLQGSYAMQFPFSPHSAGHPALPPSESGPSRCVGRWQETSQRTCHTPILSYPWSPLNFGCQTLSPGCPTLSIHDPVDFPLAPPEQPQEGRRQGSPEKHQQGPGDAMVWTPGDITTVPQKPCASAVAVEFLGRQASRSQHTEPDHGPSGLSTDIHPLVQWGLRELAQPPAANCVPDFSLQGTAIHGLQGAGAERQSLPFEAASHAGMPQDLAVQQGISQPAPEQQSAILKPSNGLGSANETPGGLGNMQSDGDANGGTLGGQHRPSSSQLSTYSNVVPGAFPAVYQPASNGVVAYPTADTSGASPSALMPVMRTSEAVVGSFSPEFVPNVYSHSTPPGMTSSLSVVPPQTPGEDKSATLTSISTWTRRSTLTRAGRWAKRCNCKKSKCLKLYCDCFAAGEYCGACTCQNCQNSAEHKELVEQTRESISQRNPQAFIEKISKVTTAAGHRRGCNCRKSNCKKKYCECYQAGVNCGQQCKCEACQNTPSDGLPPLRGEEAHRQRMKAMAAQAQIQEQPKTSPGTPTATVSVPPPLAGLCPDSRGTLSEQRVSARNKARRASVGTGQPGGPDMQSGSGTSSADNPLFELPEGVMRTVPEEMQKNMPQADMSGSPPAWHSDAYAQGSMSNSAIAADLVHASHLPSSEHVLQPVPGNLQPVSDASRPPLLYTLQPQAVAPAATPPSQAGATVDLQSIFAGSQMLMNNQQWYQQLLQQGRARQAGQACSPSLALPMQHGPSPQGIPSGILAPSPSARASSKQPIARPTVWAEQHVEEGSAGQEGVAGLVPLVFNEGLLYDDDPACASNFMESVPNSPYFERENRSGLANLVPERPSEPLTDVQELEASARETAERLWGPSLANGIFTKRPGATIDLKSPNKGGRKLRAKMQMVELQPTAAANIGGATL